MYTIFGRNCMLFCVCSFSVCARRFSASSKTSVHLTQISDGHKQTIITTLEESIISQNHTGVRTLDLKQELAKQNSNYWIWKNTNGKTHKQRTQSQGRLWFEKKKGNHNLQRKRWKHIYLRERKPKKERLNCECKTINVVEFILHWEEKKIGTRTNK